VVVVFLNGALAIGPESLSFNLKVKYLLLSACGRNRVPQLGVQRKTDPAPSSGAAWVVERAPLLIYSAYLHWI
jgi:hypothetical protein